MAEFPARIHILLARDSSRAVVIRRGPSKEVASIFWDRTTDEFSLGQWLKGRVYERRSDISPDGRYWIYFAMNGKWSSESQGSWTAISNVPYLKAIVFMPKGDCWNGGGIWTSNSRYWLNDGYGHELLHDSPLVQRDEEYAPPTDFGGECLGVYYVRLLRDGWTRSTANLPCGNGAHMHFDKPLPSGWVLRKTAHAQIDSPPGKGCYWDEHSLVPPDFGEPEKCPGWEWADFDGKRLMWAKAGKIFASHFGKFGTIDETELADLNEMRFRPIQAPS